MATVAQLSDTHLRSVGGATADERLERVVRLLVAHAPAPELVILTGDLTDDCSLDATRRVAEIVARLGVPVLALAGNHDDPAIVATVFGDERSARIGEWTVVAVETMSPGQIHGTVNIPEALARLDATLDGPVLVALHHPPAGTSSHPMFRLDGGAELLTELFRRPNVRGIVSGHLHEPFSLRAGHLDLLGAPSTYVEMRHDGDRFEIVENGLVGARLLGLGDSGSLEWSLVATRNADFAPLTGMESAFRRHGSKP